MTELLNNREIATLVWTLIFVVMCARVKAVRQAFARVVKAALHFKVLLPAALLIVYVAGVVGSLYVVGFWSWDLLKGTLLWLVFTGLVLPFAFVTGNHNGKILPRVLRDTVTVAVVIEFLVSAYTFPLLLELILLPLIAGVVVLKSVAEQDEQHSSVAKLMGGLEVLIGATILGFTGYHAFGDFQTLGSVDSLRQFALPIVLSIAVCPFAYVSLVVARFEMLFMRVSFVEELDERVKRYAKWRIARHLRFNPYRAQEFSRIHAVDLLQLNTRNDVDNLLARCET